MPQMLATVMFTDLVGSTALRSSLGDDRVDELVAEHDRVVGEIVSAGSGEVVKFLGDGGLAVFSSAVDATDAAVAIQAAFVRSEALAPLEVRIGLHAGEIAHDGTDIAGLPVAIASRLCALAQPGEVVVSDIVTRLVGTRGGTRFDPLGDQALKGVPERVFAWTVPIDGARSHGPMAQKGGTTVPFPSQLPPRSRSWIAREQEMGTLDDALTRSSRQHLVAVSGEPGIGKTALVSSWAATVHAAGTAVLAGRSAPDGGAPYQPFIEAVRPVVRADPSLSPRGAGAPNLARLLPELTPTTRHPPVQDDARTERYVIMEAFVELLANITRAWQPLVLVLDDLQWSDEASLALLAHLLRHPDDVPLLVVGTYRDTDLSRGHPLASLLVDQRRERRAERIDLSGLTRDEIATLVSSIAGAHPPEDALAAIVGETEGNPFFIEEIVHHFRAEGVVSDGRWVFRPGDAISIPQGIRDTIGRRLDSLTGPVQETLSSASVLGPWFTVDVLSRMTGRPIDELEDDLDSAIVAGFLRERADGAVEFSHALVRQTVYDELTGLRRSRHHRNAGEALESAGAPPDVLAHHWLEAHDHPKALAATTRALRAAESAAASTAVISLAEQAMQLWDDVPALDRPADAKLHEIVGSAGLALALSKGSNDAVEFLRDARRAMDPDDAPIAVGALRSEEARHLWALGDVDGALDLATAAVAIIPEHPASRERANAVAQYARILSLRGDVASEAESAARTALDLARAVEDPVIEAAVLSTLGIVVADADEGERLVRMGLDLAERHNAAFQIVRARSNLSELLAGRERLDESVAVMAEALEIADRLGVQGHSRAWLSVNLGEKLLYADQWEEARRQLVGGGTVGQPHALQLALEARIAMHSGRFAEAEELLDRTRVEYGHITDVQYALLNTITELWMARWTGRHDRLSAEMFDPRLVSPRRSGLLYGLAVLGYAADVRGSSEATPVPPEAVETSLSALLAHGGPPFVATATAEHQRWEGVDDPEAWRAAWEAWPPDSYQGALAALGLARSVVRSTDDALGDSADSARRRALETAQRLGASPLAEALRQLAP